MSLFADLFSCGKARKPRETPTEPHGTTTANDVLTANTAHDHVRTPEKGNDTRLPQAAHNTLRLETGNGADWACEGEGVAVAEEKTKRSSGWMVEHRVLVEATPPVRCATPELHLSETTPAGSPSTGQAHGQVATPIAVLHGTAPAGQAITEPAMAAAPLSAETPELEADEVTSPALDPGAVTGYIPAAQRKAPVQLLDLPPEIRKHIYELMSEEEPIRMCRHDDPVLALSEPRIPRRQFHNLTQVRPIRDEFLPIYAQNTKYIIDLWAQKAHLAKVDTLKGQVSMDIDAACFDMEPIDILPLIRCLVRTRRTDVRFASTEGVVFRSIQAIVDELNKLLPSLDGSNRSWLDAVNGPMKRIDLHLFPHEDVRQYYRFRGAEPLLRIVYPSAASEEWMKRSSKSDGYEQYLAKTGLDRFGMHVVVGHASRRTTNEDRLPLDWRMSLQLSRLSVDGTRTPRMSMDVVAARMSMDRR